MDWILGICIFLIGFGIAFTIQQYRIIQIYDKFVTNLQEILDLGLAIKEENEKL